MVANQKPEPEDQFTKIRKLKEPKDQPQTVPRSLPKMGESGSKFENTVKEPKDEPHLGA